jgi:hypothetical protein
MRPEIDFWNDYYKQLLGAVIKDVKVFENDDMGYKEYFPCFLVKLMNGQTVQVDLLMDPEGNGPGFLEGLPSVKPAKTV